VGGDRGEAPDDLSEDNDWDQRSTDLHSTMPRRGGKDQRLKWRQPIGGSPFGLKRRMQTQRPSGTGDA